MVSKMENGHGKVWICLLILVLAAVVIGLLYYTTAAKEPDEEGFLIRYMKTLIVKIFIFAIVINV